MDHTVISNDHRREWVRVAITEGAFAHWKTNHPITGIAEQVENLGYYLTIVSSNGLAVGPHQRAVRTHGSIEQLLRWTSPDNLNTYGAKMLASLMKITGVVWKGCKVNWEIRRLGSVFVVSFKAYICTLIHGYQTTDQSLCHAVKAS